MRKENKKKGKREVKKITLRDTLPTEIIEQLEKLKRRIKREKKHQRYTKNDIRRLNKENEKTNLIRKFKRV